MMVAVPADIVDAGGHRDRSWSAEVNTLDVATV